MWKYENLFSCCFWFDTFKSKLSLNSRKRKDNCLKNARLRPYQSVWNGKLVQQFWVRWTMNTLDVNENIIEKCFSFSWFRTLIPKPLCTSNQNISSNIHPAVHSLCELVFYFRNLMRLLFDCVLCDEHVLTVITGTLNSLATSLNLVDDNQWWL